ncbi:hypothetical protein [Ferruginibacter profundus]
MKKSICLIAAPVLAILFFATGCNEDAKAKVVAKNEPVVTPVVTKADSTPVVTENSQKSSIDTADYNARMKALSNYDSTGKWPVKTPYPLAGALLPYNRIVSFYGNLYSKKMGILGELPKDSMLKKLQGEVAQWQAADPGIHTIPALHYIAITAQGAAGKDGKHRLRMPLSQVDTMLSWAKSIEALVFVDIQVGHSTVKAEVPTLEKYLALPNVHLGIDPEFSMKGGEVPGSKIGTFSSDDINDAIDFLAELVRKNNLPPKVLIVHRFTQGMVTGYTKIKTVPEVQVVMDMDGFGSRILKKGTYLRYIYKEPVQFTGFKLFYKNDNKTDKMYTPKELLQFTPRPSYIQYQ